MKKKLWSILKIVISISILSFLIFRIGPQNIYESLKQVNLYSLVIVPFLILGILLTTLSTKLLLNIFQKIKFWKLFKYVFLGWSFGLLTPGKIGEFSSSYYLLKNEKTPLGISTSLILLNKLIIIFLTTILALIASYLFLDQLLFLIILSFIVLSLFFIIIFFYTEFLRNLIKKYFKTSLKFAKFSETFKLVIKKNKSILFCNLIIAFSRLLAGALVTKIFFIFLGYNIPFVFLVLINAVAAIGTLFPFTLNGMGVVDSLYLFLLSKFNIPYPTIMSYNIFILIVSYTIAFLIITLYGFNKNEQ